MDKELIKSEIAMHQKRIGELEAEMVAFDDLLENNQYDDHDDAEGHISERYRYIASEACEGSYCYGDSEYKQRYQINGDPATYEATITFEYNRHDKTYYYIDGSDYSYAEVVEPATA